MCTLLLLFECLIIRPSSASSDLCVLYVIVSGLPLSLSSKSVLLPSELEAASLFRQYLRITLHRCPRLSLADHFSLLSFSLYHCFLSPCLSLPFPIAFYSSSFINYFWLAPVYRIPVIPAVRCIHFGYASSSFRFICATYSAFIGYAKIPCHLQCLLYLVLFVFFR